ncbi:MAG: hypothetical protein ABI725_03610 [Chloroflexota bacterium]
MLMLRELVFRATRGAGGVLPLPVLLGVLYPAAFARALLETLTRRGRGAPSSLPPGPLRVAFRIELRERTSAWLSTAALLWADRFARSPWRERFDVAQLDALRSIIATRPALIATLHFGGIFVMPTLLRALDIPTAAAVGEKLWPVRWWRERRAQLTRIDALPAHIRSGDARSMVRFLEPGQCLLVALDYPLGDQVSASYHGASLRLSTPSFRLARLTGAAIVPMLVRLEGVWSYSVHVGRPVPDELVAAGDYAAIAGHVVNELLPLAASRPEQALPLLVKAFESQAGA